MNLDSCFVCNKPVLELDGQYEHFQAYGLNDEDSWVFQQNVIGKCHDTCISSSEFGTFWYHKTLSIKIVQKYHAYEIDGSQVLLIRYWDEEIIVLNKNGTSVRFFLDELKKAKQTRDGIVVSRSLELNVEMDYVDKAEQVRSQLLGEKKVPLKSLYELLELEDQFSHPEIHATSYLVYDRALKRYWVGSWISSQCIYNVLIPADAIKKLEEIRGKK
jgi:hypothetical protein